jgi:hypothetical protein
MRQFSITTERYFKNLSASIIFLLVIILLTSFSIYNNLSIEFYFLILIVVLLSFPALIIHINFWLEDRHKTVGFDIQNKKVYFNKDGIELIYNFDEIKYVILVQHGFYSKNTRSGRNWAAWSNYFYFQIELKNNEKLYITSLSISRKDFPIPIQYERFVNFPKISNFNYDSYLESKSKVSKERIKEIRKENKLQAKNDLQKYRELYKSYSQAELQEIIENEKKYEYTAVIAARELLKK